MRPGLERPRGTVEARAHDEKLKVLWLSCASRELNH